MLLSTHVLGPEGRPGKRRRKTKCDVAIVGGGIAGLYTAETLLRKGKETNVCVFERETRLGGRLYDYVFPQVPDEIVGLGGWRIDKANYNLRNIVQRLNIPTEEWNNYKNSRTHTRGNFSRDPQEIKEQSFPAVMNSKFRNMGINEMYDYLVQEEHLNQIQNFATFETFQQYYLTPEGTEYYYDIFGYESVRMGSPEGIVEFYDALSLLAGDVDRPLKGMSAIPLALARSAKKLGAQIYAGDKHRVVSINEKKGVFYLKTVGAKLKAKKLVIAVPPGPFVKIAGNVAKRIQLQEEFKSVMPRTAFKAAAVYQRAWWEDITDESQKLYPMEKFLSHDDCLGWTVPHRRRGKHGEAVLHVSYKDGACGEKWGQILKLTRSLLDREIHRALEYKFNMTIPRPLETAYQFWDEGAWHFQRPGSGISMKQVSEWAKRPFAGKEIYVASSAYNMLRAWAEGAVQSANNALYEGWGIPIPSPPEEELQARRYRGRVDLRMIM